MMHSFNYYSIQAGNFFRGAYELKQKEPRALASAAGGIVTIKEPPAYDFSHWTGHVDWPNLNPKPALIITKATEADNYKDPTFPEFMQGMTSQGIRRGAYHFFRRSVDPVRQANWFVDYITPYITNQDILALDFEEGGETAAQLWGFINRVQQRRPNNLFVNYSRKSLMDAVVMNASEKEFFKKIKSWPAGYPNDPNPYITCPASYIPDQSKWGPVWLWQYSSVGVVQGVDENSVDLNLIEQPLKEWLGLNDNPPDQVTHPYDGVERIRGRRANSDFIMTILDPQQVEVEVVHDQSANGLERPSVICNAFGAQFAWNGDEYDKHSTAYFKTPIEYAVSNGIYYVSRKSAVPSLNIRQNGTAEINHVNFSQAWNVTSGYRYLIQTGIIQAYLYGNEIQYIERHPRSCFGLTQAGKLLSLTIDGRSDISAGATLLECAQILKEFGAYTAYDRGSGGDSVEVMDGIVQNIPCDINAQGQNGQERAVSQFILAFANIGDPMTAYYKYTATANRAIRTQPGAQYPRIQSFSDFYAGTICKGGTTSADTYTLPADVFQNGTRIGMKNDEWVKLYENNGTSITGWTAKIHMGIAQVSQTLVGDPPVEPPATLPAVMDATIVMKDKAGTALGTYKGILNKQ